MIAITQGIGPAIRPSGSRPRSAAPNLRTPPFMRRPARRMAQRAGRIGELAAVEPQHLGAGTSVEQMEIVGGDDDGGAELVQRIEQMEQPRAPCPDRRCRSARRRRAIRAGRSPRGRWRRAAARRPKASPGGRWRGRRGRPRRASRAPASRDRLSSTPATRSGSATLSKAREMRDQPEILEDDADPPAEAGQALARHGDDVLAEQADQPAARPLREIEQLEQRGLARARRAGEEIEAALAQRESEIATASRRRCRSAARHCRTGRSIRPRSEPPPRPIVSLPWHGMASAQASHACNRRVCRA